MKLKSISMAFMVFCLTACSNNAIQNKDSIETKSTLGKQIIFALTGNNTISVLADSSVILNTEIVFQQELFERYMSRNITCYSTPCKHKYFIDCEKKDKNVYTLSITLYDKTYTNSANQLILEVNIPTISDTIDNNGNFEIETTTEYLFVNILPVDKSFRIETKPEEKAVYKVPYNGNYFQLDFKN